MRFTSALDKKKFRFQTGSIKRCKLQCMSFRSAWFRFQTGSIKRRRGTPADVFSVLGFDSKLVRLKVKSWCRDHLGEVCFDSKLVRLKDQGATQAMLFPVVFRFQTGSIKRRQLRCWMRSHSISGFDSKLVRLKVFRQGDLAEELSVSIPNWFD